MLMLLLLVCCALYELILECIWGLGENSDLHPVTGVSARFHHQMESQAEEQSAETQKERKLRERNEQYSRQLEEELERLKVALQTRDHASGPGEGAGTEDLNVSSSLRPAEAGWLLHGAGLGGPGSGGGTPARRPGEEDAAVRGGTGAQGGAAQHGAEGPAEGAAGCGEPAPRAPEGGPDAQRQVGENSP